MVLSKEEKKTKKAQKLELFKAEEAIRKQKKKDELVREITAHSVSRKVINKKWNEAMVNIKEPVFRKDIEVMRHTLERNFDKKDHLVDVVMHLNQVADDQYQRTVSYFCDKVDSIINKFLSDVGAMSKQNDTKTAKLLRLGDDEMKSLSEDKKNTETRLQLLLYSAIKTADNLAWKKRGENMVKKDEDTNNYSEVRDELRYFHEIDYIDIWDQYKATLKAYVARTFENQKHVQKLRRKQNMMADIIAAQDKKMANIEVVIKRLRVELASYESGSKQASFRSRRTRHRNACNRLKKSLYIGQDTDVKQLSRLVKASDDSINWIDAACKKVDKILRIAALCRKFETQREKVLPYSSKIFDTSTQAKVRQKYFNDSMVFNVISSTCAFNRLWQRISEAEVCKKALYREKRLLEHENADMMCELEERNEEQVSLKAFQCACVLPCRCIQKSSKRSLLGQPNAVEGSLEAKKVISFI